MIFHIQHRTAGTALAVALAIANGPAATAAPVTATFDLTSPTPQIVALPGATAVFTADTGIKFSAYGGVRPSLGSGINDADVRTAPGGAGVAGDSIVQNQEFFNFFGPSNPDGTPLPGRWTAFTATGDAAPGVTGFLVELREWNDINNNPGFYEILSGNFLTPQRFTIDRSRDETWTFTLGTIDAAYTIKSLEYTYDSSDFRPVPVPAAVWLFGSALAGLIGFGRRKAD